jgi:glycosyltransferase 2 family protein
MRDPSELPADRVNTDTQTAKRSASGRVWLTVRLVFTATVIGLLVHYYSPHELLANQGWTLVPVFAVGTALLLATLLLNALRWSEITAAIGAPVRGVRGLVLVLIGHFFNQLLPTSFGGDAVRIWGVWRGGSRMGRATAGVLLDRLSGLVALALLVICGVPLLALRIDNAALAWVAAGMTLLVPVGILVMANAHRLALLQGPGKLRGFVLELSLDTSRLLQQPRRALLALLLSLGVHSGAICLTVFVANSLGVPLSFFSALLILPAVLLLSSLPISIAGWGVREAGLTGGFLLLGLPADAGVTTSIIIGIVNILAGLPGALLFLFERSRGQLMRPPASS